MAIEILNSTGCISHHPRHDLESILYVIIYICTFTNGPNSLRQIPDDLPIRDSTTTNSSHRLGTRRWAICRVQAKSSCQVFQNTGLTLLPSFWNWSKPVFLLRKISHLQGDGYNTISCTRCCPGAAKWAWLLSGYGWNKAVISSWGWEWTSFQAWQAILVASGLASILEYVLYVHLLYLCMINNDILGTTWYYTELHCNI